MADVLSGCWGGVTLRSSPFCHPEAVRPKGLLRSCEVFLSHLLPHSLFQDGKVCLREILNILLYNLKNDEKIRQERRFADEREEGPLEGC